MKIQDIYNNSKDNFLFNESKDYSILRKKIINSFNLSTKEKKNNESLKYIDPEVLKFSYKYRTKSNNISYSNLEDNNANINVLDGKISNIDIANNLNSEIKINNIDNSNSLIEKKFLDFQSYFNSDYILNLNSLMLNSGYEINIGKGCEIVIFINNIVSEKELTIFQKNYISCAKNSKVIIVEDFASNIKSNKNIVNFLNIEEDSDVTHLIFQNNNSNANLQSTSYANCYSNSKYKQLVVNISKSSIRNHHYANLNGEGSSVDFDGVFFGSKNQFIDNKTQVNHYFPNCNSSQCYKGILTDQAKASYLSKTFVDSMAQKTEAYQLSKGILLSDDSYFHSKPELRIFADDVKCSHGSTIGPIDKDLLFYLRSRGLSKKISTSFLIKSLFHDVISKIKNKNFVEKFNYQSNIWLRDNNI